MKRGISSLLVALFLCFSMAPTVTANVGPSTKEIKEKTENKGSSSGNFNLDCNSAILMEPNSGKVIYEHNANEKFSPASVTKVMTMLLTMEGAHKGKFKLSDKVTISEKAMSMGGSTMFLEVGEVRTVEDLLKGIAVESANDAAVALAEFIGGTEDEFASMMNKKAKELGMKNSNFVNSYGFYNKDHYTTAYDIALMSRELLSYPKILDYTKIWMETITEGRKEPFTLTNRNKMIRHYNGCDGLKTGYIKEAMFCISATAKRGDTRMLSVIMGAPSWKERNAQAGQLLDYGFSKFSSQKIVNKGDVVKEVKIPRGKPESVKVVAKNDLVAVMEKGNKSKIEKVIEIDQNLKLPLKKGDKIGKVTATSGSEKYGSVDLILDCNIEKTGYFDTLKGSLKIWLNIK
ncbi:D-alanyl-D-alanine carboxypeptidase family protein [Clostridium cylindrosporum]|uniref:serine-type D-Ala-D-Ala carboxypeptidase n=1 Tax=Clostridium cylindrosporum DSM 605 TaxID=1121307 RepID=A0A0J8DAN9_CLOCY|nr:D-alanyl-D-alanine carboxypeptidase family protein [Clostridium cylindrosporum]KMT21368.1 D-alanyl-D-alanine carboxypeptidase DacF [Clostridium cylindrosporum DSM 605]